MKSTPPLKIIFVDDDDDDHFIFAKALDELKISTKLHSFINGENLMKFLSENLLNLPDVIFLDLNMPRKNGSDCLIEIKKNKKLKHIPVVIYSTSFHPDVLDLLYKHGAFYCIRKSAESKMTKKMITFTLQLILENKALQPAREKFTLGFAEL